MEKRKGGDGKQPPATRWEVFFAFRVNAASFDGREARLSRSAPENPSDRRERYAHYYPESLRSSVEVLDRCCTSVTISREKLTLSAKPHKIRQAEVVEQADAPDSKL
ncbi:MAG: hypothetical protein ABSC19_19230 [Syntrophorhabdales bacterium]|jgi:hypothetical protein